MTDPLFWGTLIVTLRQEQHLSQRMLAQRTNVNRSTLRKIEQDGCGDILVIESVLNYLGYELEAESLESKEIVRRRRLEEADNPNLRSKLAADGIVSYRLL